MTEFFALMRRFRRNLKDRMPWIRRRLHAKLQRKYEGLLHNMLIAPLAPTVAMEEQQALQLQDGREYCLFMSYAARPQLKPHVQEYIRQLLQHDVQVILLINTDVEPAAMEIAPELRKQLSGVLIRRNAGYDFAAWAHAMHRYPQLLTMPRLYLINDSMLGPLNDDDFGRIIQRVRASSADLVGLTENLHPQPHIQSFFLVMSPRAMAHPHIRQLWTNVKNLSDKSEVIDVYECQLTRVMHEVGLQCEVLFPSISRDPHNSNDVFLRWTDLLAAGLPFVKASVARENRQHPDIVRRIPASWLTDQ